MKNENLLRIEQAAERAQVSYSTAMRMIRSGKWPSVLVGVKSRRVPEREFNEMLLEERKQIQLKAKTA